jgi:uncharacterized protein YraI
MRFPPPAKAGGFQRKIFMKKVQVFTWILALAILLSGCLTFELKDEREMPTFYEIALVTHTPPGYVPGQATAGATAVATALPSKTPTTEPTSTPLPSPTLVSPTPAFSSVVLVSTSCRQGPGESFPGASILTAGEKVTIVGRNPEATWWLVQKDDGTQICWALAEVIAMEGEFMSVAIMSALPTPTYSILAQPLPSPTQKARQKPPRATQAPPPAVTDTPAPYPSPSP